MRTDVIVVGGGVVGLAAARAAAGAGARVVLIERGRPGGEASGAAAGMLAAQADAGHDSPLLLLELHARTAYAALVAELQAETGISVEMSRRGHLHVAFDDDQRAALVRRAQWQQSRGLEVHVLTAAEVRDAEPNLAPAVCGGLLVPGDLRVDNVRLGRALAASAVNRGAVLVCGRKATALEVEGGRVAGVRAGDEVFRAPAVINAAGAWSGQLQGDPAPPPVVPVRGQMVAFDLVPPFLRHVVWSPRPGYLVPRPDGGLLAGSTLEQVGFDKSVTADGLRSILGMAVELAPRLGEARVARTWAGLRPASPDGLPILGPGALPGLVHATGLFRGGILLGPLAGEIAAALALGRPPGLDLTPFSPARFARR